jgi:EF-P beta-lysylation protein EpmB
MDCLDTKQSIVRGGDETRNAECGLPSEQPRGVSWQELLKTAIRQPRQLIEALGLAPELLPSAEAAARQFGLFAPLGYVARMRYGEVNDPLLRQVLPLGEEMQDVAGFSTDPVGDGPAKLQPGVLQKYAGRALLITTGACAIHCRYCFRRHYPYSESPRSPADWQPALDQIAADESIDEVILSGGDPLTLVDAHLAELARRIAAIGHVKRLRIHTRLPIVIPERVTGELLAWLRGTRLAPIMVVHANHPQELDDAVLQALAKLVDAGIPLLNQAVLLRGVNDNFEALHGLCTSLVNARVMPYYLHQLDRVAGGAHFEVPLERGRELISQLRASLPGYAVPRYVAELPGEASKTPLEYRL